MRFPIFMSSAVSKSITTNLKAQNTQLLISKIFQGTCSPQARVALKSRSASLLRSSGGCLFTNAPPPKFLKKGPERNYAASTANTYVSARGYSLRLAGLHDPTKVFRVMEMLII